MILEKNIHMALIYSTEWYTSSTIFQDDKANLNINFCEWMCLLVNQFNFLLLKSLASLNIKDIA